MEQTQTQIRKLKIRKNKKKKENVERDAAPPCNVETRKFNHWYHRSPTTTTEHG